MKEVDRISRGFTLVEIQVVLLLTALLFGVMAGCLYLAGRIAGHAEELSDWSTRLMTTSGFLRQEFETVIPLIRNDSGGKRLLFSGKSDEIEFVGLLPERAVAGGPWLLHLYRNDRSELRLDYRPLDNEYRSRAEEDNADRSLLLLESVKRISLAYLQAADGDGAGIWKGAWIGEDELPRAIRLRLELEEGRWPELVARLWMQGAGRNPQYLQDVHSPGGGLASSLPQNGSR